MDLGSTSEREDLNPEAERKDAKETSLKRENNKRQMLRILDDSGKNPLICGICGIES